MIVYILPYYSEQRRITAVIHGTVDKDERVSAGYYVLTKSVLFNISGELDSLLMTRFGGWFFNKQEVLFEKTDVIKQIFDPTPGKGSVRY